MQLETEVKWAAYYPERLNYDEDEFPSEGYFWISTSHERVVFPIVPGKLVRLLLFYVHFLFFRCKCIS